VDEWASERGLVLVFERGGFVYVYQSYQEAAGSIESMDLDVPRRLQWPWWGHRDEAGQPVCRIQTPASKPTGRFERETLATLIKQSGGPQELADRPHDYAMAILQQGGSV
jgi:hypothetical protein